MDVNSIHSPYYIPENTLKEKKMAAFEHEPGMSSDLFALILSFFTDYTDPENVTPGQAINEMGQAGEMEKPGQMEKADQSILPKQDHVSNQCLGPWQMLGSTDHVAFFNAHAHDIGWSARENMLQDSALSLNLLLQGAGKKIGALPVKAENKYGLWEPVDGIPASACLKDFKGKDLAGIFLDQIKTAPDRSFSLNENSPVHEAPLAAKGGMPQGLTALFTKDLSALPREAREPVHEIKVLELLKDAGGEIKPIKSNSRNQTGKEIFSPDFKAVRTGFLNPDGKAKDLYSPDKIDLSLENMKNDGTNQFSPEEISRVSVFKEIAAFENFHLSQPPGLDAVRIWAKVIESIKQIPFRGNDDHAVKEIEIKLHPAELGKLEVLMKMEDGRLHLVINASDQATGHYLQSYLGELRQSLTQLGISCGSMEMGFQGEGKPEQEEERGAPKNHDFFQAGEEENFEYKVMYNLPDFYTKTRINVSV